jgi:hypothetical protein
LQQPESLQQPRRSRLLAGLLAGVLALGAGPWPPAAKASSRSANQQTITLTASSPARFRLGPAPPVPAGSRRVVSGKIVGLEPPDRGPISIEAWLLAGDREPAVFIGRFSPFPVTRIEPKSTRQHQPFVLPVDGLVPARGGGDWTIEFRLSPDPAATPGSMQIRLGGITFAAD